MGHPELLVLPIILIALLIPVLVAAALYFTFRRIPPQHHALSPGLVWLLVIPCFSAVWNFIVFTQLSRSLQRAYRAGGRNDVGDCGFALGIAYAVCVIGAALPILGCVVSVAAVVLLVIYLLKVDRLSRTIPPPLEGEAAAQLTPQAPTPEGLGVGVLIGVAVGLLGMVFFGGIIAAIAIPNLLNAIDRGKQKRTMADMRSIDAAIQAYRSEHDAYPDAVDIEKLRSLLPSKPGKPLPTLDGWSHAFVVEFGDDGYSIVSYGKNGTPDGCEPGTSSQFNEDICLQNGHFIRYPEGSQQ